MRNRKMPLLLRLDVVSGDRRRESFFQVPMEKRPIKFLVPDAARQLGLVQTCDESSPEMLPFSARIYRDLESGLIAGFQLATAAGHSDAS